MIDIVSVNGFLVRLLAAIRVLLLAFGVQAGVAADPGGQPPPADGLVTRERDALHRVFRVNFPETATYPAFSIETQWDVFGRATQTLDQTGTSTAAYDDLNRPTTVTPAAGQGATFQYLKDAVNKRHISRMTVTGAGTWE